MRPLSPCWSFFLIIIWLLTSYFSFFCPSCTHFRCSSSHPWHDGENFALGFRSWRKWVRAHKTNQYHIFSHNLELLPYSALLILKTKRERSYHPSVKGIRLPPWGGSNSQDTEVGNAVKYDKPKGHADHCDAFDLILDVGRLRKLSFSSWPKFFNSLWNDNRVSNLGWSHLHQESREDPGYFIFIINSWDCFKIGNLDHSFHQHHNQNQNTYFL